MNIVACHEKSFVLQSTSLYLVGDIFHPLYNFRVDFFPDFDSIFHQLEFPFSSAEGETGVSPDLETQLESFNLTTILNVTLKSKFFVPPPIQPAKSLPAILMATQGPVSYTPNMMPCTVHRLALFTIFIFITYNKSTKLQNC